MNPRRPLGWVLAACAGIAGCNVVFSLDDYAGTNKGGCTRCVGTHCECAHKPPDNFQFARLTRAPKFGQACPSGMLVGPALGTGQKDTGCACDCTGPSAGTECGLALYSLQGCSGAPTTVLQASSGCASIPSGSASARDLVASGTCTPGAKPNPPEFATTFLACLDPKPASDDACGSGSLCTAGAAAPFDSATCVIAKSSAENTCPAKYSHSYTFATGFTDLRNCGSTGCSCKTPTCAGSDIGFYQDSGCAALTTKATEGCSNFGGLTFAKVNTAGKTVGECSPSGQSTLSGGTLTASGTLLVCCDQALNPAP